MTITEFLEARIAEDEAEARAASPGPWKWDDEPAMDEAFLYAPNDEAVLVAYGLHTQGFLECTDENRTHIARYDPSRVLAECAAKRAIIDEHGLDDSSTKDYCESCADWWNSELGEGPPPVAWPCPTLRSVAAVYKDHPDYQQEWAA